MDFYSDSKPDLIGPKVKKAVYKITKTDVDNATISDKISNMMVEFYREYIAEHKFMFLFAIVIIIFLLYRYYNKKRNSKKEEVEYFNEEEKRIIDQIMFDQTTHLNNSDVTEDHQPSFDISKSVNEQADEYVNFPPEEVSINIPGKGLVDGKELYPYPEQYPNLLAPKYDPTNVYENKSRSYYTGTFSPYIDNANNMNNAGQITHPFGWDNNFNQTTGNFVNGMTGSNMQNMIDYQTIVDNLNGNLIDGLKIGPKYLDDVPEVEPPYADVV
jgi:hypothetical protein